MSFKTYALEDVLEITSSKRIKMADYVQSGIPFYRSKEIIEKSNNQPVSTDIFITCEHFDKIKMKFGAPEVGDILLTSVGTLGVSYQVSDDDLFYFKDGNLTWFRNFDGRVLSGYIYCWLKSPLARKKLDEISIGTTQRALTIASLKKIQIKIPSLDVQKKIVFIYESLSKKIINNSKINQTFEQMAQALFKNWFVDFEPVKAKIAVLESGGSQEEATLAAMTAISGKSADVLAIFEREHPEQYAELKATAELFPSAMQDIDLFNIPRGWSLVPLSNIASFASGKINVSELTKDIYISTENMLGNKMGIERATSLPSSNTTPSFNPGHILISNIRPYFKKIWLARFSGGRSADVLAFEHKKHITAEYLYNILYQDSFFDFMMQTSKGVKMPRGDKKAIMEWSCIEPTIELVRLFSNKVKEFYSYIESHNRENIQLSQLRDTLLPKLLSGEITLPEAEEIAKEADYV
ncbi:restriction endonuclease subunit S [Klebsiella pneumoniae]|uniref:restriction endonuclease subunit S n=1 Tax=Klebsiella pneumoniae TaxID=573 RepID=UPI002073748B|nr:restriction endonuclease subunit S [Klebsiella pneumoniae]HCR1032202.1 restriction endonuclease subunit S [Klebsiella aerogenes]MCP6087872.1 restriction endonuclease subunit S [Klebsiella pneumoniae]HCD3001336.1 restriction endonuclease subunit S [Klebsiella pneumoniae]HCD6202011.1 restriction endonuclease subunit S [Klebsiella pneumoniae]